MKDFYLVFAGLLQTILLSAQDPIHVIHSCSYDGEESGMDFYQFESSDDADRIVAEICNAVSLSKNFIIKASNVKNALATTEGRQRYILYSTSFLEKFNAEARTRWAAYSVLAHEIGHHLNGHNFSETDPSKRKRMELEADKFSDGVLRLLNASLNDAQAGIETLGLEVETATHPPASARKEAIATGWKKQDERQRSQQGTTNPSGSIGLSKSPDKGDNNFKTDRPEGAISKDCETKNNGDFCFENRTNGKVTVRADYNEYQMTLDVGQTQCFYSLKLGNYIYSIEDEKRWIIGTGQILVEKCKSKTFVIK